MCEVGTRFTNNLYLKTILDEGSGDCSVIVETIDNDGIKHEIRGNVVWEE